MMSGSVRDEARAWLAQDPDPQTRAELSALLDRAKADPDAMADLADRFAAKLEFGTAGLRGQLGAGPGRMNRLTVMRTSAGLAWWLGESGTAVVGYDARHRSAEFARDAAVILAGTGMTVRLLPRPLPTPVLAYAVRALRADAGVMVTASHNPPRDNGYKVYVGGYGPNAGSQIIPPADAEISAAIDAVDSVDELPHVDCDALGERIVDGYIAAVAALPLAEERDISVTYTPLHGVGGRTLLAAFNRAGFPEPYVVPEQAHPDPDFPTVPFPNPEEPGAMDLALAAGEAQGSDLVLANDPDADRLAVAVPGHGPLTGDEVGALLGEHVLRRTSGPGRIVATTIVSSSLLSKIAAAHGVRCAETHTGFKWLVRAGAKGERNVFCYEEALGYCVGSDKGRPVADKDGIGAALVAASLAAAAKRDGRTLLDLVDEQARKYGLHLTRQLPVRFGDPDAIGAVMRRLRQDPPRRIGAFAVEAAEDFADGLAGLPAADALRYRLTGPAQARLVVRPSGTEPKLKAYLEVALAAADDVARARTSGAPIMDELYEAVAGLVRG